MCTRVVYEGVVCARVQELSVQELSVQEFVCARVCVCKSLCVQEL